MSAEEPSPLGSFAYCAPSKVCIEPCCPRRVSLHLRYHNLVDLALYVLAALQAHQVSYVPPSDSIPDPTNELASSDDEFDQLMRSSPPVENTDQWDSFLPQRTETGNANPQETQPEGVVGPIRNVLTLAQQLAASADLKPYQRTKLFTFIKSDSSLIRDMYIFVEQCSLHNKLEAIISSIPAYEISEALDENIKSVVVAVLLSSKLSSYKGDLPKDAVIAILLKDRLHIPSTFDRDTNVSNTIESAIKEELTQCRSKIKKLIRWSVTEKKSIYTLATKVVKDTRCTITVPLCGKLAVLRKVYIKNSGVKFWDMVDSMLEKIRIKAGGSNDKISTVLRRVLDADKALYLQTPQENTKMTAAENNPNSDWQRDIDLSLSNQPAEQ